EKSAKFASAGTINKSRTSASASSWERQLQDFVTHGPARHPDLGNLAHLLAEQALADGAGRQDLVLVVVLIAGADELETLFLAGVEVLDAHAHAEDDGIGRQVVLVDEVGPVELVLEVVDAGLQHPLVFARGVVLGVLAQVAQVAGGGDPARHLD